MSDTADKTTEKVIDTAADVVSEVKDQAADVEELIRSLNRTKVQFYALGMVVGGITGAVIAYRIAYRKAETKYSKIADEEIAEMAQDYRERKRALESEASKRPLKEIIAERGYTDSEDESVAPPMAVQPPASVVEEVPEENEKDTAKPKPKPVVPVADVPERLRNVFTEADRAAVEHQARDTSRDPNEEWNWYEERKKRSPDIPYVIHYDERHDTADYQDVTLTYYTKDDVVCNERDEVLDHEERETLVGEANLERFGHGSGDEEIVFVRNDKLEILFEICRSPNSYAEEVHGFSHEDLSYNNLERMRRREQDEPEE